jgi:ubiquinone/menaquinone biosynthesis C-methylase UbiE
MLCVGVGTGNEIPYILNENGETEIVGVDTSERALRRAYRKGLKCGKEITVLKMDAQNLRYHAASFNKVLCLHVMDFVEDDRKATKEILRVLEKGGQFVITYPSEKEGIKLGVNLLKDSLRHNINSGKFIRVLPQLLAQMGVGIFYLPLLFRAKQRSYSRQDLIALFTELKLRDFWIEEYSTYNDFIVHGKN